MRSALFCDVTQRTVVIPYRRFGTTYRSHLQGSRDPRYVGKELPPCAAYNPRTVQIRVRNTHMKETLTVLWRRYAVYIGIFTRKTWICSNSSGRTSHLALNPALLWLLASAQPAMFRQHAWQMCRRSCRVLTAQLLGMTHRVCWRGVLEVATKCNVKHRHVPAIWTFQAQNPPIPILFVVLFSFSTWMI
jgi:hypothetical protein